MSQHLVLMLLAIACLDRFGWALPIEGQAKLEQVKAVLEELQAERRAMSGRLDAAERELKRVKETPKIAFAASLGGNGLVETTNTNKDLIFREVLVNEGGAYNSQTGVFTAPIRGVYYIRFTANAPTNFPMSAVLYKNAEEIQLIVHEQTSGEGSDTASNGATLLLEKDDKLKLVLWSNTQIWDNSNHHSTFSGFLLFPMVDETPTAEVELKDLQTAMKQLQAENINIAERLEAIEKEQNAMRGVPKVAFTASLGGNGLQKTTSGNVQLVYSDVLTNIGQAYNSETGVFKAPVRGVYYIRFTTNAPTDFPMSSVLYKNNREIMLITHEQPSGNGSDTASNGAAFLLEKGDTLSMSLWHNTQIWDNSNHHSTFTGFLLFPLST